jgi:hypothetical protein
MWVIHKRRKKKKFVTLEGLVVETLHKLVQSLDQFFFLGLRRSRPRQGQVLRNWLPVLEINPMDVQQQTFNSQFILLATDPF